MFEMVLDIIKQPVTALEVLKIKKYTSPCIKPKQIKQATSYIQTGENTFCYDLIS